MCVKILFIYNSESFRHYFLTFFLDNVFLFQRGDVGTQYRSGIYYYSEDQARLAKESLDEMQKSYKDKIVTEILPAKKFYRAEEYHQQYLEKGELAGSKQSAAKGCNDPIRCYGWQSMYSINILQ